MKNPWKLIFILINFRRSEEITVQDNETVHAKVKKTFYDESNGTFYDESNGTFDDDSNGTLYDELNGTFYAELIKASENLTMFDYEIGYFKDRQTEVRNTLEG